jgi:hypothetical protein
VIKRLRGLLLDVRVSVAYRDASFLRTATRHRDASILIEFVNNIIVSRGNSCVAHPIKRCFDITSTILGFLATLHREQLVDLLKVTTSRIVRVDLLASDPSKHVIDVLLT